MKVQRLIEKYKELYENVFDFRAKLACQLILQDLEQLDEPSKVKVPQFVADFIAEQKKLGHTLSYSIDASMSDRVAEWYWDNSELFALAWIFGYEVEEEKRYYVRFKWIESAYSYLTFIKRFDAWTLADIKLDKKFRSEHTRKQLEEADFGWVFDCPGIEIEEVE